VDPGTGEVAVYNLFAGSQGKTSVQKLVPAGPGDASLTRWVVGKSLFSGNGFLLGLAVKPGTSLVYFSDPDPENPNIGELDTSTNMVRHWPVEKVGGLGTALLCIDGSGDVWITDFVSNQIIRLRVATDELTGFPIPTRGGQPGNLACDTVIGFTENTNIAYLTPDVGSPSPVVVNPSEDPAEMSPTQTISATPFFEMPVADDTAMPISSSQPVVETGNFYEVTPPSDSFPQAIDLDPTGPARTVFFTALEFDQLPFRIVSIPPSPNHIGRVTLPAPSDVTGQVRITPSSGPVPVTDPAGKTLYQQQVTLQNFSTQPIPGPLMLVLKDLSSNTTLVNKTGTTLNVAPSGSPFITLNIGPEGVLNEVAKASIILEFDTLPANTGISSATVLAGGVP